MAWQPRVHREHMLRHAGIEGLIRAVKQYEEEVEARQHRSAHAEVLRHRACAGGKGGDEGEGCMCWKCVCVGGRGWARRGRPALGETVNRLGGRAGLVWVGLLRVWVGALGCVALRRCVLLFAVGMS
eukprot:358915-Chlamydomonas_euryale.AAC.4